ncbi:MAG: hypothetical protein ACOZAM_23735 [Pseudomonadota bacterium]
MPIVPEYQRSVALRPSNQQGIDVNATPEAFGAAIGRGMQSLAQGVADVGKAVEVRQAIEDETIARSARNAYMADKDNLMYGDDGFAGKTGKAALDGYDGFGKSLGELRLKHSAGLTPTQQKLFNRAIDPIETDARRSGMIHRSGELKNFTVEAATNGADALKQEAVNSYGDDAKRAKYLQAGLQELAVLGEKMGWAPEKLRQIQADYVSDANKLTALRIAQDDPIEAVEFITKHSEEFSTVDHINTLRDVARSAGDAVGRDGIATRKARGVEPVDAVVNKIIGVESGGNPAARNPRSTAAGLGQFVDDTWVAMLRKYRPTLAAGKSRAELIEMKSSAGLSREMTKRYAEENASILQMAGFQASAGNVYLAHFLGPGGAKTILGAGDAASVSSVLPPAVIDANPFLRGMTVADIKDWAAKKMGGEAGGGGAMYSPRVTAALAGLPADTAAQVREIAERGIAQHDAQAASEIKAQRLAVNDNYRLRIAAGDASISEQEILDDPILDDGDKATLLNSYNEKNKELRETQAAVQAFRTGVLAVDAYSADGRKSVDAVWKAAAAVTPSEQIQPVVSDIVRQTGLVPAPVMSNIRSALTSGNALAVAGAAAFAGHLNAIDPAALGRRDGGREIMDAATMFDHLNNKVGLTPDQAARRLIDLRDPEKVAARKALMESEPVRKFIEDQATEANVRDVFDPGLFGSDPALGETPAQAAAMTAEYRDILAESIFDTAGDTSLGIALAAERFKRRYGVSDFTISGAKTITRYPPEIAYPAGVDGTHGYIRDQVKEALGKAGVSADEVYLQPGTMTETDVKAGRPARYEVWYSKSGVLERWHQPFYATPPSRADVLDAEKKKAMKRRDENIRKIFGTGTRDDAVLGSFDDAPARIAP